MLLLLSRDSEIIQLLDVNYSSFGQISISMDTFNHRHGLYLATHLITPRTVKSRRPQNNIMLQLKDEALRLH